MYKGLKVIRSQLKAVDAVIEVRDARLPFTSWNQQFRSIYSHKRILIFLNKSDLADSNSSTEWLNYLQKKGERAVAWNAKGGAFQNVKNALQNLQKHL